MGNWISVDERLPDDDLCVNGWDGLTVWIAYHDADHWFWANGDLAEITHWQPLPEPPEVST